jgi:hypothetical protein
MRNHAGSPTQSASSKDKKTEQNGNQQSSDHEPEQEGQRKPTVATQLCTAELLNREGTSLYLVEILPVTLDRRYYWK